MATAEQLMKMNKQQEQDRLQEKLFKEGMDSGIYQEGDDSNSEYKQLPPEKGLYQEEPETDGYYNENMDERPDELFVSKHDKAKREASKAIASSFGGKFWLNSISPDLEIKPFSPSIVAKKMNEEA